MSGFATISHAFWEICCLKRGPQDIPASSFLFRAVLLAYVFCGTIAGAFTTSLGESFALNCISTLLLIGFVNVLLRMRKLEERSKQTTTALMGAAVALFPLALALTMMRPPSTEETPIMDVLFFGSLVLLIWQIAVTAHIMRHAFSTTMAVGVFITLAFIYLEYYVAELARTSFGLIAA